uniref:C2H2-type domain-containing protein n=1 Tax=Chenopodium quinoa TaxID=63459 RepID=A0A803N758_CHEQI
MLGGSSSSSAPSSEHVNMGGNSPADNGNSSKRKRRPAGTPDPDAEVVSLSPKTLLESDRYVCEICNQGFQRDQNLQMHRRRHKVPWKLLKRENPVVKKRVFVCPEPTCLHHDPCHALGDLVGIKKHFRRKHSNHKQWVCDKCSKAYAVQSDYKAHLKTCGTRGHSCDCGRVFSSPSNDTTNNNVNVAGPWHNTGLTMTTATTTMTKPSLSENLHNLELQLSVSPKATDHENQSTQLQLSIGSTSDMGEKNATPETNSKSNKKAASASSPSHHQTTTLKEQASEQLKLAMAEKAYAEDARREAKRQIELAEKEFANAKRIRQQAQAELDKAQTLKDHAMKQISATLMQITCHACKQQFNASPTTVTTTTTATTYALHLEDQNSSLAESQVEDDNNM